MKLVTFQIDNQVNLGGVIENKGHVINLTQAGIAGSMIEFIEGGEPTATAARDVIREGKFAAALSSVKLLAPIPQPRRNIFCIGRNYLEHAKEIQKAAGDGAAHSSSIATEFPIVFSKPPSCVIAHGESIPAHLDPTNTVDYEGELAVVIGRSGRGIKRSAAFQHVFGYTIVNDVTARTVQRRHKQWLLGKGIDGFCPLGPTIVTSDEIADVKKLQIKTQVNGEDRQSAFVDEMIFDIPELIETISELITLEPGDIIATGTPAGVGAGFEPPKYLRSGDSVSISIDPIGTLTNPVA